MTAAQTVTESHVDTTELRALVERRSDVTLLDVRSPGEFAGIHIDGSCNVPLDVLRHHGGEVVSRLDGPTAIVCAQGVRSLEAAKILAAAGAGDLRVLDGGLRAWQAAGGPVVRGKGKWAMDRQVRLVAGSLVLAGVLTSTVVGRAKWLAGMVGAGLLESAVTDTCGMAKVLGMLPYNKTSPDFDLSTALAGLGS
jgi:rhodanese-related sulfurtransferase